MIRRFLLICLMTFTGVLSSVMAQSKHALIFAIGNYPQSNGWSSISSLRDAEVINKTLTNQRFEDIRIYRDAQVTPEGIATAFKNLINDKNLHEGDIVVIHFSSHGEQVEDDNKDEVDRLDESIVTYNAVSPLIADKKDFQKTQKEYFRDDQFGDYINQLRNKLGRNGNIIVFIDACHSGTGTRGAAKVRGGQSPLVSETFDSTMTATVDIKAKGVFREKNAMQQDENDIATYIVFSAARSDELDYEAKGKGLGSLSYAIGKVFEQLEPATTYRSLFAKIQSVMIEVAPNQHPVMEGNGIDRELFGSSRNFISQKPYVVINKIKGTQAEINSGLMAGLDVGAKVIIHNSGTQDPKEKVPLASGTVTKAFNYTSIITLDKALINLKPIDGWAFVTERVYNVTPINIGFSSAISRGSNTAFSETEIKRIKEQFKDLSGAMFEGEPELLFVKGEVKDSVRIKIASVGYVFKTIQADNSLPEKLKEAFEKYAQYKFLRDIEIKDPDAQVEIKLVPVINGKADTAKIDSKIVRGIYEFNEGDKFAVWIKNKGNYPLYINILDLQPDAVINPIFPDKSKNITPTDLLIESGSSVLFSDYPITLCPPYGMEVFKIFVSRKLIDMEGIAESRGVESRGNFTLLASLLKNSYNLASRGGGAENLSNTDGSTFNVLFRIKKK